MRQHGAVSLRGGWEVFTVAVRLGLTSFGGPIAHIGYYRAEYVERRKWLDDGPFAELVALAQFLPGPSSSQVGAAIGFARAGWAGALAAWLAFTLPSAAAMALFAVFASSADIAGAVWVHALKLVAVAIVLDAVIAMARTLASRIATAAIAVASATALVLLPTSGVVQVACLAVAAVIGVLLFHRTAAPTVHALPISLSRGVGLALLMAFAALFVLLPVLARHGGVLAELAAGVYRAGSLVFGGGHVVLPLLQSQTVPSLVSEETFLTGYGAAQAVPGPLFTFATFLGQASAGAAGAVVATIMIFLPGMLLFFGALPFWRQVRSNTKAAAALVGVNAGVVGLLAAAWIDPIVTSSIAEPVDVLFAAALFALLRVIQLAPWIVVVLAVVASPLLALG